ncbi:hypothetical protein K470DRAFT_159785 [Piedraia hortae CBS 480.64]|uniref:Uncharacterized protein n=1 Tax=Piedraia hortae CBS 480.64 TaxID=1314780 RepID=A0A6A7BTA8_9PEZI|nr:hypothetical protein K470DRAFT_159785 [Piedraia hortae CBS 480.64]
MALQAEGGSRRLCIGGKYFAVDGWTKDCEKPLLEATGMNLFDCAHLAKRSLSGYAVSNIRLQWGSRFRTCLHTVTSVTIGQNFMQHTTLITDSTILYRHVYPSPHERGGSGVEKSQFITSTAAGSMGAMHFPTFSNHMKSLSITSLSSWRQMAGRKSRTILFALARKKGENGNFNSNQKILEPVSPLEPYISRTRSSGNTCSTCKLSCCRISPGS